jgi:hypothetical protein
MDKKELQEILNDKITAIEIEDKNGNTIFYFKLKEVSVADVENTTLRLQYINDKIK